MRDTYLGWYGEPIRKEVIDMINKNIRIIKVPICTFGITETKKIKLNMVEYPCRLCIIDQTKKIIVDVEHKMKYPYISKFDLIELEKNKGKRIGFIQYNFLELIKLSSEELKNCVDVVKLLNQDYNIKDGIQEMSNEEYLKIVKLPKNEEKNKELTKKR